MVISANLPTDIAVDTALALPVFGGKIERDAPSKAAKSMITAGTLTLNVNTEQTLFLTDGGDNQNPTVDSHVIVTYKDTGDRFKDADTMRFINVPLSETESALNLFTSSFNKEKMELGDLVATEDSFVAKNGFTGEEFTDLSADVLAELAKTDDALRSAKNSFMNFDPISKEYMESKPFFRGSRPLHQRLTSFPPSRIPPLNIPVTAFILSPLLQISPWSQSV